MQKTEEEKFLNYLKKEKIFKIFSFEEMQGITKNGGVAIMCSDGDIDIFFQHIKITPRPHCIKIFGGPFLFAPSFRSYNREFINSLMINIKLGMELKNTKSVFLYFHFPCDLAKYYEYDIEDIVFGLIPEVYIKFASDAFFFKDKIYLFIHLKEEDIQTVYRIDLKNKYNFLL